MYMYIVIAVLCKIGSIEKHTSGGASGTHTTSFLAHTKSNLRPKTIKMMSYTENS